MFLKYIFNVLHFVSMACTIKTDLVETKKKHLWASLMES